MRVKVLEQDREHLVLDNMGLVRLALRKYIHPHPMDYEDLYQEGCVGLIYAAINFDENMGFKFTTYAVPMIIGTIKRYNRDKKPIVKYSRSMLTLYYRIAELRVQGLNDDEILKHLNISSQLFFDVLNIHMVTSLDYPIDGEDGQMGTVQDTLGCSDRDIEAIGMDSEGIFERSLNRTVAHLGEIYQAIYEEYIYSKIYGEKLSQQYFAEKYQISQAQVSRILRKLNKVYYSILKSEGVDM